MHARLNIRNKAMSDAGGASDTDTTMSEYSEMFSEQARFFSMRNTVHH